MTADDLAKLTLVGAAAALRDRRASSTELTTVCLERIERHNPRFNAFITVTADSALEAAAAADQEISDGRYRSPLHGVPIALKDLVDTAGVLTTAGSGVYHDRVPEEDAEVVRRLNQAGAISLGKLNMHEFAYGGTSHISHYGAPLNPWNLDHIAGGSSGGSSAAVAARLCFGALGSDTGGSIRQPSALCGLAGLKPTWGRVSLRGIVPLSWSLDHVGPMTRTVADAAAMLQVIAGHDPADPGSANRLVPDYSGDLEAGISELRLGVPREGFFADLDPDVAAATEAAMSILDGLTASRTDVALPITDLQELSAISGPVLLAEAHAYHEDNLANRADRFDPDTLSRVRRGASISAATYILARRELDRVRHEVEAIFDQVDVLITPTTVSPAPTFAEVEEAGEVGIRTLRNTSPFDAYGLPTITVPVGLSRAGLPIGVQISGPAFDEQRVLRVAHALEQLSGWSAQPPPGIDIS